MKDQPAAPANCAACAFWRKLRENEGVCTRHAPQTSIRPEEPAHWPQTHRWQWCGDGVAAEAASIGFNCLRRLCLLAPARARTPSGQPRRHADGLVGACRDLRPPRAADQFRTRSTRFLAGDAGDGFLRRWGRAGTRRDIAALGRNGKSISLVQV
jgi:hypothetical protein